MGRCLIHGVVALSVFCACPFAHAKFDAFVVEDSGEAQLNPAVCGGVVVWGEPDDGSHMLIRAKEVGNGASVLTHRSGFITWFEYAVTGPLIIWSDARAGDHDIYAVDIQTGEERIITQALNNQIDVAAGGHFVVWKDDRNSRTDVPPAQFNSDIYALDMRTGQEIPVCTALGLQEDPDVDGDVFVWTDQRRFVPSLAPFVRNICGYDATTGQEFLIAEDTGEVHHAQPAISGKVVVWAAITPDGNRIMGRDISEGDAFVIQGNDWGASDPDIDGRYVVWSDIRNGTDYDLWGYDLLTGEEFAIFLGPGDQKAPKISGNLVVWYTSIPGETHRVWAAYIPDPASLCLLAAGGAMLAARRRRGSQARR